MLYKNGCIVCEYGIIYVKVYNWVKLIGSIARILLYTTKLKVKHPLTPCVPKFTIRFPECWPFFTLTPSIGFYIL